MGRRTDRRGGRLTGGRWSRRDGATPWLPSSTAPYTPPFDEHAAGPHPLRAGRGRAAHRRALARVGPAPPRAGRARRRRTTRSRSRRRTSPASLHMGHALNGSIQDTLIRYHRMRGQRDEVDPRHRPRRDRDPEAGREARSRPRARSREAARARGVRRARLAVARGVRRQIIEQFKRLGATLDYDDERFTLDERYVAARCSKVFVDLYEQGPHLPRPLHGQLGPGHALGDLRPRGRGARGDRHALPHRLPARGRRGRDRRRDRAPRDDARRHRGRGEPRRRALPPPVGKTAILPLVGRPPADHRRRLRQDRLRHRRAEDHARPRPQRLRDRPPPRPRGDQRHRRGRPHDRGGRPDVRGPDASTRRASAVVAALRRRRA